MFCFDTTALIAMVSELTYDPTSIQQVDPHLLKYLTSQIEYEISHSGELANFFAQFEIIHAFEQDIITANSIIDSIAGIKERNRWLHIKEVIVILPNNIDPSEYTVVTANKKLKKYRKSNIFIYHTPRSLLGI